MQAYGDTGSPATFEEDHLIPLELGGAPRDPHNLWSQPHSTPNEKDTVEGAAHDAICTGKIALPDAQHRIATDWYLWGARSRPAALTWVIGVLGRWGMIVSRVVASALSDLPEAVEPAVAARSLVGVQGRRTPGAAPRSHCAAQGQPEAPPGLGGSSGVRRARPLSTYDVAGASIGHTGHDLALASSLGRQEVDLSASRWATARR
jgi:hypothetical protein